MSTTNRQIKPHALNRDFTWEMTAPQNLQALTPGQYAQFDEQGFVKLENVFTPEEVAAVAGAIDPLEAKGEAFLREQGGRISISEADVITFTTHIVTKSDTLKRFAAHPKIQAICRDLIGGNVRLYWDQSVYKKTGKAQEFPWHQDNGYTFIEPQQYLTLWIPLVDVDEQNGCPWIAPGLHKGGTLEHWLTPIGFKCLEDVPDAVSVPGKAGDVIAFSSLAPHRTGPNLKAGSVRKAYILQYAPDDAYTTRAGVRVRQDDPARQFMILEGGSTT
ncbi:MAG TPA: phytanoyl-CoA dioxygenase family protein [Rhizomicrobium sp.]|jgi:ectoine hydroxylase-related dioxygenase (phytanoyl-CoA dioxygenase family)|nr:phytanoyl-CoA dioxygenase family protein [Rhizomicrobium sp.]